MTKQNKAAKKPHTGSSTGLLIGLMLSFLIGLAMIQHCECSLKHSFFPYGIALGVMITTVVGYKIGDAIDEQNFRDDCLGILDIKTDEWVEENHWNAESYWQEHQGREHRILTTMVDAELVSIYNGSIIAYHGRSANHMSVNRFHAEVKNEIINKLKEDFNKEA
ncbi:MAG: hypothetical protein IE931_10980 [Sphingobacteriales bacterium]|nr:hypothetical protein [Sphingobacteriales bacterium]